MSQFGHFASHGHLMLFVVIISIILGTHLDLGYFVLHFSQELLLLL